MPVIVRWDDTHPNIIVHHYSGDIVVDDYLKMLAQTREMLNSVSHPVHIIFDRRYVTSVPRHLSRVMHYVGRQVPPNLGQVAVVGAAYVTKLNYQMLCAFVPQLRQRVTFVESLQHAYQLLDQQAYH